jgi:hypothetical protein
VKVSTNSLIAALTHRSFYLSGDENSGVALRCRDHHNGGRPLAYYDPAATPTPTPTLTLRRSPPSRHYWRQQQTTSPPTTRSREWTSPPAPSSTD